MMCIKQRKGGDVVRTNIVIDDTLMRRAMDISGRNSKKEIVHAALAEIVERRARRDLSELRGHIKFDEFYDYKAMRARRPI
jgi:Arc/MetJ family transcription regulator